MNCKSRSRNVVAKNSAATYQSVEDRDAHIESGMEEGMIETLDRLACILLAVRRGLDAVQLGVLAALGHQFVVRADLDCVRTVQHDDHVGHAHRGEPV